MTRLICDKRFWIIQKTYCKGFLVQIVFSSFSASLGELVDKAHRGLFSKWMALTQKLNLSIWKITLSSLTLSEVGFAAVAAEPTCQNRSAVVDLAVANTVAEAAVVGIVSREEDLERIIIDIKLEIICDWYKLWIFHRKSSSLPFPC